MIHTNETAIVSVNNTPFKSLGRTLPVAKIAPPNLLDNTLVYQIPTNKHQCGIGQVGQRPVAHRMNEHFWEKRGKRGPYASTKCRPFTEMKVLVKEPHQIMRMSPKPPLTSRPGHTSSPSTAKNQNPLKEVQTHPQEANHRKQNTKLDRPPGMKNFSKLPLSKTTKTQTGFRSSPGKGHHSLCGRQNTSSFHVPKT